MTIKLLPFQSYKQAPRTQGATIGGDGGKSLFVTLYQKLASSCLKDRIQGPYFLVFTHCPNYPEVIMYLLDFRKYKFE
ncbi:MAG: hypothetical protein KJP05_09505, partial [Deltaproteobacteria bacterium]|nr:hypothetical protein [Deltaproteobacteria bacterium]